MAGFITLPSPVVYPNGSPTPVYIGKGNRVNANSSGSATSAAALPTGSRLVVIRSTESVYLAFGTGSVSAVADETSILFLAGELVLPVPEGATHFSIIQVTTAGVFQIEQLV